MATVIGQAWSQEYGTMEVEQITACFQTGLIQLSGDVTPNHSDTSSYKTLYYKEFQYADDAVEQMVASLEPKPNLPF